MKLIYRAFLYGLVSFMLSLCIFSFLGLMFSDPIWRTLCCNRGVLVISAVAAALSSFLVLIFYKRFKKGINILFLFVWGVPLLAMTIMLIFLYVDEVTYCMDRVDLCAWKYFGIVPENQKLIEMRNM